MQLKSTAHSLLLLLLLLVAGTTQQCRYELKGLLFLLGVVFADEASQNSYLLLQVLLEFEVVFGCSLDLHVVIVQGLLGYAHHPGSLVQSYLRVLLTYLPPFRHFLQHFTHRPLCQSSPLLQRLLSLHHSFYLRPQSSHEDSDSLLADEVFTEDERGTQGIETRIDVVVVGGMEVEELVFVGGGEDWVIGGLLDQRRGTRAWPRSSSRAWESQGKLASNCWEKLRSRHYRIRVLRRWVYQQSLSSQAFIIIILHPSLLWLLQATGEHQYEVQGLSDPCTNNSDIQDRMILLPDDI